MARSPNILNQETGVTSSDEEYLDFDDDNLRAIAEVYKDAGNDEYRNKKFDNAMYFYTKGIKVNCKDDEIKAQLYSNRAMTHFYQENYQDSLKDARTAVELNPACIKAIARGARACGKLGLYEEAITWCDKGLAISKNSKTFSDLRREFVTGLTKSQAENKEMAGREMENERGKIQNEVGSGASNESRQANIRILEFCLKTEQETGNKARQKTLLFMLVDAFCLAGDIKKAIHYSGLLVQLAKEMNDRPAERTVYGILGNLYNRLAEYEKAFHYHELHLQLAKETCDRTVEGVAYGFLGNDYRCVGDLKKAIYYFELELNISKEVGNRVTEGIANHNLGNFFNTEGNFKKAIKCFEISSQIAKESHDRIREGNVCGSLGYVYQALGELSKAIHYHKLYRKITQELGDRSGEGKALGSLGSDYYLLGDFKTAIYYHELSLQIAKDVRDRRGEGIGYRRLGRDLQCLGHFKEAISYHELSLKFSREIKDRWEEGEVYGDLGDDYYHLGDFKKALHYFELYLQIAKEERYKLSERFAYGSLGSVYQQLGDFRKAIYYHELSLNIAQELGLKTYGSDYGNLGCTYGCLGDFETALHYGELHLKFTKDVGDRHQEGRAYGYLGSNYLKLGKFKKAIMYHERELEMAREDGSKLKESFAYNHLAVDFATLGDTEKAIYFHEKQLQISKEVEDKNGEGQAYGNLGLCFYKLRDFRKAKAYMEHSLTIAKSTGNKVEEAEGYSCLGLNYNEMGLLSEAVDHWKASIRILNEVRDCLQFQDKWKISLRQQYQTTYGHLWHGLLRQGKAVEALIAAEQGRAQALKDLMQIKYGFETWKDDLSSVEKTLHSTLRCLPSNTIFEAAVGKQVYFWVIQGGEMEIVQLTCKEVGDNQAVDFDAFVSSLKTKAFEEIGVRAGVKCEDRSLEKRYGLKCSVGSHPCQSPPLLFEENSLRTLYNFIIDPIVNLVSGDELLIVPEGNLWLAPYAALLDSNSKYLSESFRIRMIPSLTIWKLIADCPADYHLNRGALLVGDPWVQEIITPKKKKLEQLPCAREEVRMIGKILNTAPLIGTDATKEEVLKRLSSVALVHIAAHGRLETGEIALTPNPSSSSQPPKEEDYLLTMTDVLNVNLRARLVVLSSCHSGRGDVKAEGVVGIARAFLGAGARSVLVSQWAIDDEATLEFMKLFYIKLAEGRRASEALNQAMKSMRESDAFNEVKYWAPFVLIGDDVNLNFRASSEALHPEHYSETESE